MSNRFWQIRAAKDNPKVGEVLLYGIISSTTWWGDEVTPKQFKADLDALGDVDEIRVYINSDGGDVFAGQAIHSMLKRHKARVTVYIDGLAASIASVIAMAGDRVIMPRNAMMMIHQPWTFAAGNAADFRKLADELDKIAESLIAAYVAKTGLDRDRIIEMLDAETWMTAEEAVAMGFADEIEESKKLAAALKGTVLSINGQNFDLSKFRKVPPLAVASGVFNGVSPEDVSEEKAPEDTPWSEPTLSDFTDKQWEDLTEEEKRRIAGHYAWAAEMPPNTFGDLKLPHHRASDGAIVWRGVANAAARLPQTDIPEEDVSKVQDHLGRHYRAFGKVPPWEEQQDAWEAYVKACRRLRNGEANAQRQVDALASILFPDLYTAQVTNEPTATKPPQATQQVVAIQGLDAFRAAVEDFKAAVERFTTVAAKQNSVDNTAPDNTGAVASGNQPEPSPSRSGDEPIVLELADDAPSDEATVEVDDSLLQSLQEAVEGRIRDMFMRLTGRVD